ncbi:unnamed protein product [Caenorhabditis auriculariae]|uniref:G-protein coupled receptors family 1 profile domain-containing protein n=1 Tax=Caenorhabditis auriculariae TaxID=2777116 RepID=A0A8S1HEG7_9PELO|nr:unnamed protein product [Caenorhabditis auriculariae]
MNCSNASEIDCIAVEDVSYNVDYMEKLEIGIYILCFVVGGPLNVLSLHRSLRAFRQHKAKSQIMLLRISLNVADLITLFVFVPRQIVWLSVYEWYGGEFLCRVCAFFSTFSFYSNSFVIACIAIDRVYGAYNISSLNAHRKAYIRCRTLLAVGWMAAFALSLPQTVIFTVARPSGMGEFMQCSPIWTIVYHEKRYAKGPDFHPSDVAGWKQLEMTYNIVHLLFIFWIPCIIIICSYLTVLLILQGHLSQAPSKSSCFHRRIGLTSSDESRTPTPSRSSLLLHADDSYVQKVLPKESVLFCSGKMELQAENIR